MKTSPAKRLAEETGTAGGSKQHKNPALYEICQLNALKWRESAEPSVDVGSTHCCFCGVEFNLMTGLDLLL